MSNPGSNANPLEFILNRQKPADLAKLPADMQYLLDDRLGPIISEGLHVLYRVQPRHPIDYLAKWLLNHEAMQKNKGKVYEADRKGDEILKKYDEQAAVRKKQEAEEESQRQQVEKLETQFREKLKAHEYHEELLANDLPNFIEKQQKLPAIYIGMLEHPSRAVGDDEEEEYAHLDTSQPKLVTYIGASGTQKFVVGKELQPETGVTYTVFQPREEEIPPEGEEAPVEQKPNYIYVPDVTQESKMVFFRIPKLGAYLACPLSYKSVLTEKAFEEGCAERLRVQEEREKQKKDKEERDEQFKTRIEEAQAAGQETEEIEEEWKNYEWQPIEEAPFQYEERKFVLCVDTLGEDREITEDERKYVSKLAEEFVKAWEDSENRQLSRDIDAYLEAQKNVNKEEFLDGLTRALNEAMTEKYQEEEGDTELKQNAKKAAISAEAYRARLMDDDVKALIKSLANYRVIKFKPLIQNVMYFLGYKKGQVNVPGTNMLEWKEVKKIISKDNFFNKLDEYEFKGPKEGYWEVYALTDKLAKKLEGLDMDAIDQYNLGLGVLYRFVKQVVEARLLDIQHRRAVKADLKAKREEALVAEEERKQKRETQLEEAQAKATEAEEEFNKEEWETRWLEENPEITVPEEVVDDIDEDITQEVTE